MATLSNGFDQLDLARRRSIKMGDIPPDGTAIVQLFVPSAPSRAILPPNLPVALWNRDRYLSLTPRADAQWGCAVGVGIAKVAALAWDVKSDITLRGKRAQELCLTADSAISQGGWISYISKQVRDYLCTNNGCVTEIVRETLAYGSRIVGINHLPSVRCRRTGDPERPFLYIGRDNREHLLRWWQTMAFSDLPDPDEETYGGGLCAAERAYPQIIKMAAIENYVYEKVSASRPLAIHIISGMRTEQIEDAIKSAEDEQMNEGLTSYMGAVIMATIKPDSPPGLVTIDLASLPEGFDAERERSRADLIYANAIGLDLQDLTPLSNTSLGGTGQQSRVLHEKSKGKGLFMFRQAFVHGVNQLLFDDKTKFLFTERDLDDVRRQAQIAQLRAVVAEKRIKALITTPEQELQIMVDNDELPETFIQTDSTPGVSLGDTDKPDLDEPGPLGSSDGDRQVQPQPQASNPGASPQGSTDRTDRQPREVAKKSIGHLKRSAHYAVSTFVNAAQQKTHRLLNGRLPIELWEREIEDLLSACIIIACRDGLGVEQLTDMTPDQVSRCLMWVKEAMMAFDDLTYAFSRGDFINAPSMFIQKTLTLAKYIDGAYVDARDGYDARRSYYPEEPDL